MAVKTVLKHREAFIELLIRRGFTLTTFAEYAEIGYHSIQTIAQGKRNPSAPVAFKICKALDLDFDDVFQFVHGKGTIVYYGGESTTATSSTTLE